MAELRAALTDTQRTSSDGGSTRSTRAAYLLDTCSPRCRNRFTSASYNSALPMLDSQASIMSASEDTWNRQYGPCS
jgi:hypothetical protein